MSNLDTNSAHKSVKKFLPGRMDPFQPLKAEIFFNFFQKSARNLELNFAALHSTRYPSIQDTKYTKERLKTMGLKLIFMEQEHKAAYKDIAQSIKKPTALSYLAVYLLTAVPETREHFTSIYDTDTGKIKHNCWLEPWVTPTARLLITAVSGLACEDDDLTLTISDGTIWPILMIAMDWRGRLLFKEKKMPFFTRRGSDR